MSKHYIVKLTQRQLDALVSLAEMTAEGSGLTFGDWQEANPREMPALRAAERALRGAETKARHRADRTATRGATRPTNLSGTK